MAYGQGRVSSDEMNAHKTMAGAGMKGSMGVGKFPVNPVKHPNPKEAEAMHVGDAQRGAPPAIKGRQAAPDHGIGTGIKDHFVR